MKSKAQARRDRQGWALIVGLFVPFAALPVTLILACAGNETAARIFVAVCKASPF